MMRLHLIAALSKNHVIGKDNQLPWRLPNDLKHFKALTLGKTIVMGRKTYESLGGVLPDRTHIVISRNPDLHLADARVFPSLEAVLAEFKNTPELWIIGGADIFKQALPCADELHLTWVDADVEGDTYFPTFDQSHWTEVRREAHPADEKHACAYAFVDYVAPRPIK